MNIKQNLFKNEEFIFEKKGNFFHKTFFLFSRDAAHRIHPLAGMGLNLGFGDVKHLTDTLANATYNGFLLNDIHNLCEYEQQRLKCNLPIMLGVHGLQRLYNTDLGPIVLARSIGLQITQQMSPLKVRS